MIFSLPKHPSILPLLLAAIVACVACSLAPLAAGLPLTVSPDTLEGMHSHCSTNLDEAIRFVCKGRTTSLADLYRKCKRSTNLTIDTDRNLFALRFASQQLRSGALQASRSRRDLLQAAEQAHSHVLSTAMWLQRYQTVLCGHIASHPITHTYIHIHIIETYINALYTICIGETWQRPRPASTPSSTARYRSLHPYV